MPQNLLWDLWPEVGEKRNNRKKQKTMELRNFLQRKVQTLVSLVEKTRGLDRKRARDRNRHIKGKKIYTLQINPN